MQNSDQLSALRFFVPSAARYWQLKTGCRQPNLLLWIQQGALRDAHYFSFFRRSCHPRGVCSVDSLLDQQQGRQALVALSWDYYVAPDSIGRGSSYSRPEGAAYSACPVRWVQTSAHLRHLAFKHPGKAGVTLFRNLFSPAGV